MTCASRSPPVRARENPSRAFPCARKSRSSPAPLGQRELELLRAWIELNRDVIVKFWDGDILYTDEALAALRRLPDTP
jgi:hypothetical protein